MSIFAQPTQSMPQETGISSVRVDQVSSISTVNPNGGGTVAFEMTSPANSYFVPRMSYWNFRLTVTKGINGDALDETDGQISDTELYNTSVTQGGVQFKAYPAAQMVQCVSHQINGVSVETTSNVPETAAILNRTSLSHEYKMSSAASMRLVGDYGKRNATSVMPGGPLQPWNGTTKTIDCAFVSPSGFMNLAGSVPGGRHRFVITLNNNLKERVLQMGDARAALIAGSYISVSISEITLHAVLMVPDQKLPGPRQVVLSMHPLTVVMSQIGATSGNTTHTLSVPPSTDRLFVALNLQSAGSSSKFEDNHDSLEPSISTLQVQYAGRTLPSASYTNCERNNATQEVLKPYSDYLAATGRMYLEASSYDDLEDFRQSPIFGFSFEKEPNDSSTSVQVRVNRQAVQHQESGAGASAPGNLIVAAQSHQAVVLTYGDDGLVSSCDSVVEL